MEVFIPGGCENVVLQGIPTYSTFSKVNLSSPIPTVCDSALISNYKLQRFYSVRQAIVTNSSLKLGYASKVFSETMKSVYNSSQT